MKRKYRITSKFRFTVFVSIVVLMLMLMASTLLGFNTANSSSMTEYNHVKITSGDTLWELASEYGPENKDIRQVVYDICQLNDLSADKLETGQNIIIPVYN